MVIAIGKKEGEEEMIQSKVNESMITIIAIIRNTIVIILQIIPFVL
jgi:hypothetical protein